MILCNRENTKAKKDRWILESSGQRGKKTALLQITEALRGPNKARETQVNNYY